MKRHPALAPHARDLHLGVVDEERRDRVPGRGGRAEVPADRAPVADLRRADRPRGLRERGEVRAAFGSAAPTVRLVTAPLAEADGFPELVASSASPIDDVRGTADYRRHALAVLARRALERCLA